jgi:nucleolar protein 9
MGKERKSKRQLIRDEKRARKHGAQQNQEDQDERSAKRQRTEDDGANNSEQDFIPLDDNSYGWQRPTDEFEREFFGMLADEEQEYFRHADEMLELNDFSTDEERDLFLQNVYKEAEGKELKLASSQSCSRLMERLILLSNTKQKKRLFEAFAGHFPSLVTHRFASHCCEKLFVRSAPVVTLELSGNTDTESHEDAEDEEKPLGSMEDLFLLTLDELELHLTTLMSDRFGSHTLRVLLVVLAGRPIDQFATKTLLQSKKKEHVTVHGASALAEEASSQTRAVPSSFTMAVKKIISDTTASLDATALRVLAKHQTGNPVLQLLIELDMALTRDAKARTRKTDDTEQAEKAETLIEKLMPEAPASFSDQNSKASEFVNLVLYDPIGSRLLETVIMHGPAKIFKGLYAEFFADRIGSLLRNDIASYPAIRAVNRLGKEDLVRCVQKCVPEIPTYIEKGRLNVVKALFERCHARSSDAETARLLKALSSACGGDWKHLVPKLCMLGDAKAEEPQEGQNFQRDVKDKSVLVSHGSQLVVTLLGIPGQPCKAIQASLTSLTSDQLFKLATTSSPTSSILVKAFSTPSANPNCHKVLAANLIRHASDLASSPKGQNVLNSIITTPCKSEGISIPFHTKETIMSQLGDHESTLRESWMGRNVWRTWKGDMWRSRPVDWSYWVKHVTRQE